MEKQKLASIERIKKITPISGADNIVCADILGYKVVVKKQDFNEGDLCVFHYPDTIVAERPEYEFLRSKGFRIRTCKLKGQISQGLAIPVSILHGRAALDNNEDLGNLWNVVSPTLVYRSFGHIGSEKVKEGWDVTAEMGIEKYEKPISPQLAGVALGSFPSFLRKTDETNCKNYPEVIEEMRGKESYVTTKRDGSPVTFYLKDDRFGVCSRNLELKDIEGNALWTMARKYKIEEALKAFRSRYPGDYSCQGEIFGPGINGNKMGETEVKIELFNFFSINHQKYADFDVFMEFCMENGLPFVPVVWAGIFDFSLDDLTNIANNLKYENGQPAEGIVCRPCKEQESEALKGRMSFEVISEKFCLLNEE